MSTTALTRESIEITTLQDLAVQEDLAIAVGFVEDAGSELYNATAYINADATLTVYRKRYLWGTETAVLTPGDEQVTVETPLSRAGLVTCYDLNFVAESAAHTDPEVKALIVGGAWPAAYSENWRLLLRARALDGVRWVIAAGRTGQRRVSDSEQTAYSGRSLVARPDGGIHRALDRCERTMVTTLDSQLLADQRALIDVFA